MFLLNPFSVLQDRSQDYLLTESSPSENITLVTIDEKSLNEIGQWPWPRGQFAQLLRSAQSADVIGIDVNFSEASRYGSDDDKVFTKALADTNTPVVLATELTEDGLQKPLDSYAAQAELGFSNIIVDSDGVVRQTVARQQNLRSFSYQLSRQYSDRNQSINQSILSEQPVRINYYGTEGTYPSVSFSELLAGDVPQQLIEGKMLIVGVTASGISANYNTPLGTMHAPQLHANITNMHLAKNYLFASRALDGILVLLFTFVGVCIVLLSRRFWVMIAEAGGLAALYFGITLVAFELNILLDIFYPVIGLVGAVVIMAMYKYFIILREEAVLKESYQTLSTLIQNLTEGVVLIDTDNNIVASNSVARSAISGEQEMSFTELQKTLSDHFDFTDVCTTVRDKDTTESIRDVKLVDDTYYQVIISAVEPGKSDALSDGGIIVVFHDMTEEKELARVREDFTSMMVHELRSPLDAVKKMSNHLNEYETSEEKEEKYLSLISSNASQVLTLVNDLLDVSKIEAGKFELRKQPTDIRQLIANRVDFYEPLSEERDLSWSVDDDVPEKVSVDSDRLIQVMNNILSNAIKFTDEINGEVSVAAYTGSPADLSFVDDKQVHWFTSDDQGTPSSEFVVIDIADNGVGIPKDDINELFDKFKQFEAAAKTDKAGTGLGLAIVKGITEQHGGIIGVASQKNEGTHFLIALPFN